MVQHVATTRYGLRVSGPVAATTAIALPRTAPPTTAPTIPPAPTVTTPTPIVVTPSVIALAATPTPTRVVPPDPTPVRTPTPRPTVSLDEFWQRYRSLEYQSSLGQLQILPPNQRNDPFFGINDALAEENATAPLIHGLGASLDRVEVRWDEIEPAPGNFRFDRLDRLIAESERWHISVLAVVDGAPAWAVDAKERIGAGPPKALDTPALLPGGAPNPANPWAFCLATVAKRYGHRIAAWEIWNEPNFRDFWKGSPTDYAHLLQTARTVLTQTVPGSPVLLGGMVEDDGSFLRSVVQQLCPVNKCASPPFDAVAWHVYGNPADVLRLADLTRATLAPYHLQPQIWVTEANVAIDDPQGPGDLVVGPDAVSLDQQAAFVVQLFALSRAADVQTVAIYRAVDVPEGGHYWGLFRDDLTARPSLLAYRTAAEWLSHTQVVGLSHPAPSVTQIELRRPGELVNVLWTNSNTPVQVRLATRATSGILVRCTGATSQIRPVGNAFNVTLPDAPPRRPLTAPLAQPVFIVTKT
jgi:hypothetical protein